MLKDRTVIDCYGLIWPNRDPINEPGFNAIGALHNWLERNASENEYAFVLNAPISEYDTLGLVPPVPPWNPPGLPPPPPHPPSFKEGYVLKYVLGIEVDTTVVVSGQPVLEKRFVTPGSSEGTSIAGKMTDAVLGDAKCRADCQHFRGAADLHSQSQHHGLYLDGYHLLVG